MYNYYKEIDTIKGEIIYIRYSCKKNRNLIEALLEGKWEKYRLDHKNAKYEICDKAEALQLFRFPWDRS